jgi:MFS family permease
LYYYDSKLNTHIMQVVPSDKSAKRNVLVLILAQATMGSQMPMIFILGGLAGQSLASNICFATLPITMIVLGSMLAAPVLSAVMQRYGRKTGFFIGAFGGAMGAVVGSIGLYLSSFGIFLAGSLLTGIYMSAQGFYRFAVIDTASEAFRPKAISYVLTGGLLAAIIGPQLVKVTAYAMAVPYLATYLTVIALNIGGSFVFLLLDTPKTQKVSGKIDAGRCRRELICDPKIAVAIICAMVSYSLMNLMMTSTPLAVVGCGYGENKAADVVSSHVLAMFIPSFITGHLITRFGAEKIISTGLFLLGISCFAALSGVAIPNFFAALMLLGLGWNFCFIAATTMLANAYTPQERGKVQGINDLFVFGSVTVTSFASGGLMNCSGGSVASGWISVNLAMLPLIAVAAVALFWLSRQSASGATPTTSQ